MKNKLLFLSTAFVLSLILPISCGKNKLDVRAQVTIDSLKREMTVLSDSRNQLEANKKLVADFYQKLFGDKDTAAIDAYLGDTYIQHNPMLPDGKDALKQGAAQWFKNAPKEKIDIQHLSADGDLVYIHTKSTQGGKTASIIDIFRVKDNKIVEHWDVIQTVPEKSANAHPMF
ncbi:Predicted SnoaL-like aldol condensation-catalyzing enzyme [Chryseolinea serpens]|uniref:Predicted SnoaL-like aldol condensation-catalyzing enzyme n=1 Tax=Chryseolinea serpens TaxID=947013 RepID=A0A1M5TBX2_9BACT|nr:nuclear transport factor 2 family protein [Chryseolinea serpens]SHH48181.1 Predicted SnoaL-like aldol condensation-catalyzing enzyme [Chryseolinea serpens]